MRKLLTFSLLLMFLNLPAVLKGQDTLVYTKKEILKVKPVKYNAETYSKFKNQKNYDYYSYNIKGKSIIESLREKINSWLWQRFQKSLNNDTFNKLVWLLGFILVIIFGIIIYISKAKLFYINKKNPIIYSVAEEDIEVEDLDYLTEMAISENRFSDAIRWLYLKTLKILHEKNYISFDANKTVNEYVYEIENVDLRKLFRNLSVEFVYYRYGKREADMEKFSCFKTNAGIIQQIKTL